MRFATPTRRQPPESIVPMINVVFLLLIFFLMTAQIAPPDPFEMALPQAGQQAEIAGDAVLWLSAEGIPALSGQTGDAAWAALGALDPDTPVTIRADRALPAVDLARVLQRLGALGFSAIELAVQP
ncbi:biopolymer transport protein ExbD [Lutimaribacter pacificus]|uniref:Outer membrane transport energization protein ExbD n=1 Tax=Lutimaribacter pacificus TaxID=391948 RepID=A0A1H0CJG9_9RHOB|nr:biopolymer transporter ExbD [Lutimaribacter pacificus]SDN58025.1 biopolymer transport protein ExbD [Lutimaribacter pacificus]SHJ43885.1 outer membrane transport energization protein ExbD [Lutimaribacter pacificus]